MITNSKQRRTVRQDARKADNGPSPDSALEAVGDRTRRIILGRLSDGPLSVADLASGMTVSRPAVSQHLKVLKEAGLVVARAEGTRRLYDLDPNGIEVLQRYTSSLWNAALERFGDAATETSASAYRGNTV